MYEGEESNLCLCLYCASAPTMCGVIPAAKIYVLETGKDIPANSPAPPRTVPTDDARNKSAERQRPATWPVELGRASICTIDPQ